MSEVKVRSQIVPLPGLKELEAMWRHLETQCNGSFFTSWGFIGPLLKLTRTAPDLFVARRGDDIAGLALIGAKSRGTRFGKVKGLTLNQTGVETEDLVYIEHNDVLCPDALRPDILFRLARELETHALPWSELHLAGFTDDRARTVTHAITSTFADAVRLVEMDRKTSPAPYVDLARVRQEGYLPILSANTRHQISRSKRLFEGEFGPITLHIVTDGHEIRANAETLAELQIARFKGTAAPSSFTSPFFLHFLKSALLTEPTRETGAELLRIEAGETLLGLLVNFRHRMAVSNYQCAFADFPDDNRLKPGLVSHALAIEHYTDAGAEIYHFLGGDQQYKKSLSTGVDRMIWTRLQKPGPRLKLENFLRSAKARLAS